MPGHFELLEGESGAFRGDRYRTTKAMVAEVGHAGDLESRRGRRMGTGGT